MKQQFKYRCTARLKESFLVLAGMFLLGGCAEEENVAPTANRSGITSLKAYFADGENKDKLAIDWSIANPEMTDYVIPIPYYYPDESDNTTEKYLDSMKVVATLENNCTINPAISVLNLNKKNTFTYTDPYGKQTPITISGQVTRSNKCAIKAITIHPYELSGIIDEEKKTVSLVTLDELSAATAEVTLSPHARISPDPAVAHNLDNNDFTFTVTADNGVDKAVYKLVKEIPKKLPNGYRKGSEKLVFEKSMLSLGVTKSDNIHPTLAGMGNYVILNLGDGSAPQYFQKATGNKLGTVNLGAAKADGAITSDVAGNMLISNYAESGQTLKIFKTNSVTKAPELFISYPNQLGVGLGSRLHVQGDLNKDAIITATVDNSKNAIRWIVKGGVLGTPENMLFDVGNEWGGQDGNAKVVACGTDVASGCFFDYYQGGACTLYHAPDWKTSKALVADGTGSAWGYNTGAIDTRTFNNSKFLTIFEIGYWPNWGLAGNVFLYDADSPSSITGELRGSSALKYVHEVSDEYGDVGPAAGGRFGDVLMVPSEDGFFMHIFYASNTHLSFGCIQIDCIDKK